MTLTIQQDPIVVLDTGDFDVVWAIAFHPDGIHLLGGSRHGIRRWRFGDGQEIGKQMQMDLRAVSASKDHMWIVCGTERGTSVWDAGLRENIIDVEATNTVAAVDFSPNSTRFATGTGHGEASIWSISSGKRLVGPLKHDHDVTGIKFSPNGEHIATTHSGGSIRVFESHTGDEVINIKTTIPSIQIITPLAWSNDGQQIFAVSDDNKIQCFEVSTGAQLVESPKILGDDHINIESIALAASWGNSLPPTQAVPSLSWMHQHSLGSALPSRTVQKYIQLPSPQTAAISRPDNLTAKSACETLLIFSPTHMVHSM